LKCTEKMSKSPKTECKELKAEKYRESKSKIQYGEKQTRGQKAKLYVNASWSVQREWRLQWIEQEKTKGVL